MSTGCCLDSVFVLVSLLYCFDMYDIQFTISPQIRAGEDKAIEDTLNVNFGNIQKTKDSEMDVL